MQHFTVNVNLLQFKKNGICYCQDSPNPKDTVNDDIFLRPHLIITETNVNRELFKSDTEFVVTGVQYQPGVDGPVQQGYI